MRDVLVEGPHRALAVLDLPSLRPAGGCGAESREEHDAQEEQAHLACQRLLAGYDHVGKKHLLALVRREAVLRLWCRNRSLHLEIALEPIPFHAHEPTGLVAMLRCPAGGEPVKRRVRVAVRFVELPVGRQREGDCNA